MSLDSTVLTLVIDAIFSWTRMFIALGLSIAISLAVGIYAAVSPKAEKVIIPIVDILQTVPILAFFPFALVVFVYFLPGYVGINAAVIFLIITSMVWNIIFGVYETVKMLPVEFLEVASLYRMGMVERFRKIFLPASLPRIVSQSILSWSIGLFYLVTSEIFSYGNASNCCRVEHGIGAALVELAPGNAGGSVGAYLLGIGVFIVFVVATRLLFFKPLEDYAVRYTRQSSKQQENKPQQAITGAFVSWFSRRIVSARPLLSAGAATGLQRRVVAARVPKRVIAESRRGHRRQVRRGAYARTVAYALIGAAIIATVVYAVFVNRSVIGYEYLSLSSLAFSFARIWLAFGLITAIAFPLCVYLVFVSKHSSKYLLLFQILASVPATIMLPGIAILFAGVPMRGEIIAFFVFVLSGIWYLIFSIIASSRTIAPNIMEVKRLFRLDGIKAWKSIYLKALIPGFLTGALTGIAAEWNASIVAESFTTNGLSGGNIISSVHTGIGVLLDSTLNSGNLTLMVIALLNLIVLILLINTFVWKRLYNRISAVYR